MARKFLYVIAALVVALLAGAVVYNQFERQLTEFALVPRADFTAPPALTENAYARADMWYARPGQPGPGPTAFRPAGAGTPPAQVPMHAVFFVHPTSHIPVGFAGEGTWNAPLGDAEAEKRARLFLRGMATPFADGAQVWAPRYRQATFGAFLTERPEAQQALDVAYRDVEQAWDAFVAAVPPDMPIVLAGHSQGALHLLTLLRQRIAGTPVERRIAAVYPIGWPISVAHDLPALPLPACERPDQTRCLVTWSSFAEPADPGMITDRLADTPGFDGQPRGNGPYLCVNPLTGTRGGAAPASANPGTLRPEADFSGGTLVQRAVPARCDPRTGLLLIGPPPQLGPGVLPGNNYHVYDIPLFWSALRADVARRVIAFGAGR